MEHECWGKLHMSGFKRQLTKVVQKCRQVRDALVHLREKIRKQYRAAVLEWQHSAAGVHDN
jgi:hypothetical protein